MDSLISLCWYACLPVPQNTPHQEKNPELLDFADLSSCSTFSRVVCFESGKYFSLIPFMLLLLLWGRAVVKRKMSGDQWWRGREVYISSSFQSNFEICEIVILSYSDNRKKQWLLKRKQSPQGKQTFPLTYQSNPIGGNCRSLLIRKQVTFDLQTMKLSFITEICASSNGVFNYDIDVKCLFTWAEQC